MSAGLLVANLMLIAALCAGSWLLASRRRGPVSAGSALERAFEHQLLHDEVTQLPNRMLFHDRLERALARSVRRRSSCAVLALHLDRFKLADGSPAPALSDALLHEAAARLDKCVRPEDTVARTSGEEFMVLLESAGSPRDAVAVAERIAESLAPPFVAGEREVFLTASIGIAFGRGGRDRAEDVLQNAGVAVHRAKDGGGARHELFRQEMSPHPMERLGLERDLRSALKSDELYLEYQPWVELRSGRVAAMEALVRWRHPERGALDASEFVPVAEETGLILGIGRWALGEACERASRWEGASPPAVCVRVSARQLQQTRLRLMNEVASALARSGMPPARLWLEIATEADALRSDSARASLRDLEKLGVGLALQGFGEPSVPIAQLRWLPLDVVAIDRSFVAGLATEDEAGETGEALVRGLIDVCHALGLKVLADGIERPEQARLLKELGCDLGRGACLARPLGPAEAAELVARGRPLEPAALRSA